jgi:2-desacetyl-2-hydroxyethyl bacteriochlorophyllide A dehydrogenase
MASLHRVPAAAPKAMPAMLAAFCTQPGAFELREVARPALAPGEALLRIRSCGICGSDLHYFHGGFPPPPVCPGHEISAEVVEVGTPGSRIKPGDHVAVEPLVVCRACAYCRTGDYQLCRHLHILGTMLDGGFAEYLRMPEYALFHLPRGVDDEIGALTEPFAVALHAVRLASVRVGDRVLVLGGGTIGLLSVAAAKAAGATDVWITARHPQQRDAALSLGATRVFGEAPADSTLSDSARAQRPDAVIETVGGAADTINEALDVVRPGGTVAVLGVFTSPPALSALTLVVKEARLVGSLTYGRSGPRAEFDIALELLAESPERFRQLITHRFPLTEITHAFETAADKRSGSIKVAIRP